MANRLTRIYTRTGDDGQTGLSNGSRLAKDAARVHAMGSVDELNSAIGLLLTEPLPDAINQCLTQIQNNLFDLGGELSLPVHAILTDQHIEQLESQLDHFNADLPALKDFILPGGSRAAALAHMARTICRRAERDLVTLAREESIDALAGPFLNRLSDLLFVLSRVLNRHAGGQDVLWELKKPPAKAC